ncbi:calponin homology domain-containing protein [Scheffersomyces xylosifermentans]|uniref:calponin homology domain-containing protein n=1 Tax=Scheffersomyces xylosifermentans TaxID=1304137 RepID=UPI00315D0C5A
MVVAESRAELLQWLNATLDLNYTKVEQCGTGAAFCQLMDSIVGGIPMNKVKYDAKTDYDCRSNWKILQASFNKYNITKVIDVEKLLKCRLQDNLELLQWFRKYWLDNKGYNDDYDAKSKRRVSSGPAPNVMADTTNTARSASSRTSSTSSMSGSRKSYITAGTSPKISNSLASNPRRVSSAAGASRSSMAPATPVQNQPANSKVTQLSKELAETRQEIGSLNEELQEYKISSESLETERNFYFNKLREIEILIQHINDLEEHQKLHEIDELTVPQFAKQIQGILYSTEEGFQSTADVDMSRLADTTNNSQDMPVSDGIIDTEGF